MLWHGDRLVLGERSARLAETLGEPTDYAGEWIHRSIATSIEQFDKNRALFDAFLQEEQWKTAIGPVAEAAGMHAYSLLLAGAQPGLLVNADFENGNILMSTLLGADINFALAAYGRDRELDPRLVARACRDGVAVEYMGAL